MHQTGAFVGEKLFDEGEERVRWFGLAAVVVQYLVGELERVVALEFGTCNQMLPSVGAVFFVAGVEDFFLQGLDVQRLICF
jgi:hypothetical protein